MVNGINKAVEQNIKNFHAQFLSIKILYINMKVIKIGSAENIFQQTYNDFCATCRQKSPELANIRDKFHELRDLFISRNQVDELCDSTIELSSQLHKEGIPDISSLLLNELSKICVQFNLHDKAERLLCIAINNSRQNNDGLHELARIIDLERIYKFSGNRRGMFQILSQKKECCKKIIENYEENLANFRTIHRKPTSKKDVQIQLAFTYSDLAGMIERRKPIDALKLYEKSKQIYIDLGAKKEVAYLKEKIRRVRIRNNLNDI